MFDVQGIRGRRTIHGTRLSPLPPTKAATGYL